MYLLIISLFSFIPIIFAYLIFRGLKNFQATEQEKKVNRNIQLLLDGTVTLPKQYQTRNKLKLCSTCAYANPIKYTKCDNCYTNMTNCFILTKSEIQEISSNNITSD